MDISSLMFSKRLLIVKFTLFLDKTEVTLVDTATTTPTETPPIKPAATTPIATATPIRQTITYKWTFHSWCFRRDC